MQHVPLSRKDAKNTEHKSKILTIEEDRCESGKNQF